MDRFNFFGVRVSVTNLERTTDFLLEHNFKSTGYISFPDSSVIATAQKDDLLRDILNHSLLTVPDGKPLEIYAKLKKFNDVSTVSGYWLCKRLLQSGLSHYFLGSTDDKLQKMEAFIKQETPEAKVLGYKSPSWHDVDYFRSGNLLQQELDEINRLGPDLIWVGLSSPKQDFLMHTHYKHLNKGVLLGIGGVFDYLSGDVKKSPEWVKRIGMRWLWRLSKEPKRLGAKYYLTAKVFGSLLLKRFF